MQVPGSPREGCVSSESGRLGGDEGPPLRGGRGFAELEELDK